MPWRANSCQARVVQPFEPSPPSSPPVVYESPTTAMRFSEASDDTMSLCLTVVDPALTMPMSRAIATANVTRRLTGTAYGPISKNACADEIVRKALFNCCIVIADSGIGLCTMTQPARAVTALAATCRGPWMVCSLLCAGSSASECGSATGRCRSLTILRIQMRAGSSTKWYRSTAPRSATANTPTMISLADQPGVRTISNCAVNQFHAVCTNSCTMYRLNEMYPPYTITRVDRSLGRLPMPTANEAT